MTFPTRLSSGAWTTDIRCPHDNELVNFRCWNCGWKRDPAERAETIAKAGGYTYKSSTGELYP